VPSGYFFATAEKKGQTMTPRAAWSALVGLVLLGSVPASGHAWQSPHTAATFAQLHENPQAYVGATIVLGGQIIRWLPSGAGFLLLVIQRPLTPRLRPDRLAISGGMFWVEYPEQLGPLSPLSPYLTVIGEVVGTRAGEPLIRAERVSLFSLGW
jgi:starvation-inducible outer membrane lipoprotein